jgi:large subunit ribosomal protein L44e
MKFPQKLTIYCNYCRKHTLHTAEINKKKPRGTLTHGQRIFLRKMKGYGSFPKENPKGREKSSKKMDLRYKCSVCGKKHTRGKGWRAKKLELVRQ